MEVAGEYRSRVQEPSNGTARYRGKSIAHPGGHRIYFLRVAVTFIALSNPFSDYEDFCFRILHGASHELRSSSASALPLRYAFRGLKKQISSDKSGGLSVPPVDTEQPLLGGITIPVSRRTLKHGTEIPCLWNSLSVVLNLSMCRWVHPADDSYRPQYDFCRMTIPRGPPNRFALVHSASDRRSTGSTVSPAYARELSEIISAWHPSTHLPNRFDIFTITPQPPLVVRL